MGRIQDRFFLGKAVILLGPRQSGKNHLDQGGPFVSPICCFGADPSGGYLAFRRPGRWVFPSVEIYGGSGACISKGKCAANVTQQETRWGYGYFLFLSVPSNAQCANDLPFDSLYCTVIDKRCPFCDLGFLTPLPISRQT